MSDIIFPASLPLPLRAGYVAEPIPVTMSMATDAGSLRIRPRYRSAPTAHSFTWLLSQKQYDVFVNFYENDLAAGSKPFLCPLDGGAGAVLGILAFFVEPPTETVDEGMNWRVSAKLLTAGAPLGTFPRLINVDGTIGGEEPGGGTPVAQPPAREIHLENYTVRSTAAGYPLANIGILLNGRLAMSGSASGNLQPVGQWKAATNTTPASQYSYFRSVQVLDYRDGSGIQGNNPAQWGTPPVIYTTDPEALSLYRLDASVNTIVADRLIQMRASGFHPWIKYLVTIKVTDTVTGYQATSLITVELGIKPAGRENS